MLRGVDMQPHDYVSKQFSLYCPRSSFVPINRISYVHSFIHSTLSLLMIIIPTSGFEFHHFRLDFSFSFDESSFFFFLSYYEVWIRLIDKIVIINRAIEERISRYDSLRFQIRSLKFDSSRDETMLCFCFLFFRVDRSIFDKNSIQKKCFKNII